MIKFLVATLVAVISTAFISEDALARYCNNPNCAMCNRIFGPMPGYGGNTAFQTGNQGYTNYSAYPSAGTYSYDTTVAANQTARYTMRKVCINGVCSWQKVLIPAAIGRQSISTYSNYPSSTTTVSYGSTGSMSYGSTGSAATTTKAVCNCANCVCPNCNGKTTQVSTVPDVGSQRTAEAKLELEPTPQKVVDLMLKIAQPGENDWVYDLGSGDGRIVNTAANDYGAKGVGIELNPKSIDIAIENSKDLGVSDRVTFQEADILKVSDYSDASIITLYLFPDLMEKWIAKNKDSLKPGTKLISWNHELKGLEGVQKRIVVDDEGTEHWFYVWSA